MLDANALTETDLDDRPVALSEVLPPGVVDPVEPSVPRPHWAARAALRFGGLYFALYVVTTQMLPSLVVLPFENIPNFGAMAPVTTIVEWVAANVFGASLPLVIRSGSGDKTYDWVLAFTLLIVSLVAATIWTLRTRSVNDLRLQQWLRLFVRFALGSSLISYGFAKVIPLQMQFPSLNRLLERFGDFSPMGVLWASIGASPSYEIFTGCAEVGAGILLFIPHTATLGALVSLAVTFQIFMLNMTYDVPVKLFSFHLILMSLFLLAPDMKRLANVLVLNRIAGPSIIPPLGRTRRSMRIAAIAQIAFGAYLVGINIYEASQSWTAYGGGAPKSPLYGIWDVEEMSINGVVRAPLTTDYERWRRVTFDRPTSMAFLRMDDSVLGYTARIDETAKTITLTKPQDAAWKPVLAFDRSAPDQLTLAGDLDGRKVEMRLRLVDRSKFLLVTRGFNWIQEYPFNR
jgi:uncharacterized membrane protein YphA (DoxX/SURF4 family)